MTPPTKPTVVTALMLHQVQDGLTSTCPRTSAAAETVLSALTLHLRHKQASLPVETYGAVQILRNLNKNVLTN